MPETLGNEQLIFLSGAYKEGRVFCQFSLANYTDNLNGITIAVHENNGVGINW